MEQQRTLSTGQRGLIGGAYALLLIAALVLYKKNGHHRSPDDSDNGNIPSVTVNADLHDLTIYDKPNPRHGLTAIASLKSPILYDSLKALSRPVRGRGDFNWIFISFRYRHWFCFKDKAAAQLEGGYIPERFLESREMNFFTYVRYLKEDRAASYPCYFQDE